MERREPTWLGDNSNLSESFLFFQEKRLPWKSACIHKNRDEQKEGMDEQLPEQDVFFGR